MTRLRNEHRTEGGRAFRLACGLLTLAACAAPVPLGAFDQARANAVLGSASLASCKASGPAADGHVTVVFSANGKAQSAIVDGGSLIGTAVAKCVESTLLEMTIPSFSGPSGTVRKTFRLE